MFPRETFEMKAASLELRDALGPDQGPTLVGLAGPVDQPATIRALVGGRIVQFRERFSPTAFRSAIAEEQDVVALIDHDTALPLGRVSAGTLRLRTDALGQLWAEIDLPETSYARDLAISVRRGDVRGMSIGFVPREGGAKWSADRSERLIEDLDLVDVSVVTRPAYQGTRVALRSEGPTVEELRGLAETEAAGSPPKEGSAFTCRSPIQSIAARLRVLRLRERLAPPRQGPA